MDKIFWLMFFMSTGPVFAGVATPFLDQNKYAAMPAASGWTANSNIGAGWNEAMGIRIESDGSSRKVDDSRWSVRGRTHWKAARLGVMYSGEQALLKNVVEEETAWEFVRADAALVLGSMFSTGLKVFQEKTRTAASGSARRDLGGGLGVSFKFVKILYAAFGINYIRNETTGLVSNEWLEREIGLACMGELTKNLQHRFELWWRHSPRSKKKKSGGLALNHHAMTDEIGGEAEARLYSFTLSMDYSYSRQEAASAAMGDVRRHSFSPGLGWRVFNTGVLTGLYGRHEELSGREYKRLVNELGLFVSYVF